jgi:multiple sugar transport system substrate-binding protein
VGPVTSLGYGGALAAMVLLAACGQPAGARLTMSGSAVGLEADLLRQQIQRFNDAHPGLTVTLRATPDAADQRHQLYVQWLNARAADPDVLQLDTIWTAEFAAAGWIASLDPFEPSTDQFFVPAVDANRWNGALYALPWFVDVGLVYWRTDLMPRAPSTMDELREFARRAQAEKKVPFGLVWQGARYEGLVTVFLEYLGAFGGSILDSQGRVAVDSTAAVQALTTMCDAIRLDKTVPAAVLGWQEEQTRFAFQNGEAAFMRNWPYARPLLDDRVRSAVAGRFAIAAMPPAAGGSATAALGGSALAVNAFSDRKADAWEFIRFLLAPEQMLDRARTTGQYPPVPALYDTPELADALHGDARALRAIIDRAVARPATPVYSELSGILQVSLHRALTGQQTPSEALRDAATGMRALLTRVHLQPAS